MLFCPHDVGGVDPYGFMDLPAECTQREEADDGQSPQEDGRFYRDFYRIAEGIVMDQQQGCGDCGDEGKAQHVYVFAPQQPVKVSVSRSVYLAEGYFTVTLADVEQGNTQQAQAGNDNAIPAKMP